MGVLFNVEHFAKITRDISIGSGMALSKEQFWGIMHTEEQSCSNCAWLSNDIECHQGHKQWSQCLTGLKQRVYKDKLDTIDQWKWNGKK